MSLQPPIGHEALDLPDFDAGFATRILDQLGTAYPELTVAVDIPLDPVEQAPLVVLNAQPGSGINRWLIDVVVEVDVWAAPRTVAFRLASDVRRVLTPRGAYQLDLFGSVARCTTNAAPHRTDPGDPVRRVARYTARYDARVRLLAAS